MLEQHGCNVPKELGTMPHSEVQQLLASLEPVPPHGHALAR